MAKVDQRTDPKFKKECSKGCGGFFSPSGLSHHEKFCKGLGYRPGQAYVPRGKRRSKGELIRCSKGCGRSFVPQGIPGHERHCTGKGYNTRFMQRNRGKANEPTPKVQVKARAPRAEAPYYTSYTAPINAVKMAYDMFPFDSALFGAICHIAACKTSMSPEDQIKHLTHARDCLSLKIEGLSK